jgi:hypothetical protein
VTVSDAAGSSGTGTFSVSVANAAPKVTITSPAPGTVVGVNSTFQLVASFTDAGTADTHTCTISWGDGKTAVGTVSESNGSGTCSAANSYRSGNYTIVVTIADSSGATATASVTISAKKSNGQNVTVFSYTIRAKSPQKAKKQAVPTRRRAAGHGPSRLTAQ